MVVSFRLAARWWAVTGTTNSSHADLHAPPTSPWVRCGYATIGAVSSLVEAGRGRVKRVIYPPGRQWSRGHGVRGGRPGDGERARPAGRAPARPRRPFGHPSHSLRG